MSKHKFVGWQISKSILFGIAILLFFGISCSKETLNFEGDCRDIHFNDDWYENGIEDAGTAILSYYIDDNCLFIEVQYSGGCDEHDIQMAANGWIKTNPVQVDARLIHDNQDLCDALLTEEISFDLLSIRYSDSSKIIVNLKGVDEQINHTYTD